MLRIIGALCIIAAIAIYSWVPSIPPVFVSVLIVGGLLAVFTKQQKDRRVFVGSVQDRIKMFNSLNQAQSAAPKPAAVGGDVQGKISAIECGPGGVKIDGDCFYPASDSESECDSDSDCNSATGGQCHENQCFYEMTGRL